MKLQKKEGLKNLKILLVMKNKINISNLLLICISFVFILFTNTKINAQTKKQKARVSISFYKEENNNFIKVSAKYKENKKYRPAIGLSLKVYRVFDDDSLVYLGNMPIDNKGTALFNISKIVGSHQEEYNFNIIHEGSEKFKQFSKTANLKVAHLITELKTLDDNHFIEARLTNFDNDPIADVGLKVQLHRLFSPLPIGKGIYFTDENGLINIPIVNKMPGVDGKLNYEIILEDSDDYGTIKSVLRTKIGKPIEDLSTFDQRTMWSPPNKTPRFLLIFPNLIIFGIWVYLFILTFNLYRISKHKNS